MRPTDLVDETEPKPVRFGGKRKRGAAVLRIRNTRATSRILLGALAGGVVAAGVVHYSGQTIMGLAAMGLGAAVGGMIGSRERADTCASCDSSLKVDDVECRECDAPIGGEIKHRRERAAGEEMLRKERVAARKRAEAAGEKYEGDL